MAHNVELISVGTELLLGNILNTDAQFLSQELAKLGLNVYYHTVVGDNPERLTQAVNLAKTRADII
ncbi:MAG: molybdopterin-binding protein, partial [Oscillospiraceae bacterium]